MTGSAGNHRGASRPGARTNRRICTNPRSHGVKHAVRAATGCGAWGSRRRRRESPKRLNANDGQADSQPGKMAIHGAVSGELHRRPRSISPTPRCGSWTPRPRKDSDALEQDGLAEEGGEHDQVGRHHVGQHVAQDDAAMAEARRARRVHVRHLTDGRGSDERMTSAHAGIMGMRDGHDHVRAWCCRAWPRWPARG